jgi:NAD(P)-dependent dehydrogenase (short-subunit alcohol dehydrogenase family)
VSIYGRFTRKGPSGFGYASTAEQVTDGLRLDGKTVLLTGSNSGLGYESLRVLTMRGARVIATARTLKKAQVACASVEGRTLPLACDLSDPASVRACVSSVKGTGFKVDVILCCAGIMALPKLERVHGYELQFFTNHIGHFLLVTGLLDQLSDTGRVVMLSSDAHKLFAPPEGIQFDNLSGDKGYSAFRAYGQSKLANLLFAKELARRFASTGRVANAVHPGAASTGLDRNMNPIVTRLLRPIASAFVKNVAQGAATPMYVAVHPATATVTGTYFADCNMARHSAIAGDAALSKRLWEVSEKIAAEV